MNNHVSLEKQLIINVAQQTLTLYQQDKVVVQYLVSTAKNGIGSQQDSGCTPLGRHVIAKKIGNDAAINAVFVGRVLTGEVYDAKFGQLHPKRDWILSRILWLSGLEEGVNKGSNSQGGCDTYQRYIYIHGTPDTEPMGVPLSHGCVRMRNEDIVELFAQVEESDTVTIIAS
ncbi:MULTISPECIES: L,D-transpeptidase [unclassified Psychrobacter]|uniref:L,D-transpeptidase n=1 Tax=unclassified Psychrobacter TaxID=196806 RepID=UPI00071E8E7F|nr:MULTISPECIES: L,D-transpeptidase [unclassified Psychrobacter]OLF39212.1 L,D-transpeptidase [Psychrobacter sp. Cmf 22.2]